MRPRMAADLRYTTADVDFFYKHFLSPEPDRARADDLHVRLVNPSKREVLKAVHDAANWLKQFQNHPDWDGGAIHFNFAGHGSEDQGAIMLKDGLLYPREFLDRVCEVAAVVSSPGRLRISIVMDSCHSGAWITSALARSFHDDPDLIVPFNLFASCMEDEFAYEDSSLGHGLFTYCFSIRESALGSFGATGILPDNSVGPSLSIAAGERGCSLLSAGAQNPVAYWNGSGAIGVSGAEFKVVSDQGSTMSRKEITTQLTEKRNTIRQQMSEIFHTLRLLEETENH